MPTTVDVLDGVPAQFEAGTTLRFSDSDPDFPATLWTMAFVLNNGVAAATSITAITYQTTGFEVIIPASTALTPGVYQWAEYFTAISPTSEKARGNTGALTVTPNLATTATPSTAQAMVTMLEAALLAFGKGFQSFSSGGVSYSRVNIAEYQQQLVYWQAILAGEKRKAAALRGEDVSGRIDVQFISPVQRWPFEDR